METNTLTGQLVSDTYDGLLHIKGEEFPSTGQVDVVDGVGNVSSIKLGRACEGMTVCGPLVADSIVANSIELTGLSSGSDVDFYTNVINILYPVGSIYLSLIDSAPFTNSGTTWVKVSQGRFLVGVGTGTDANGISKTFNAENNTGGEYEHQLTTSELPAHNHTPNENASYPYFVTWHSANLYARPVAGQVSSRHYSFETLPKSQTLNQTGGNQFHNNLPPSYGVYVWKRTI